MMVTSGSSAGATSIFDTAIDNWSSGDAMNNARGYHPMKTLGDGRLCDGVG